MIDRSTRRWLAAVRLAIWVLVVLLQQPGGFALAEEPLPEFYIKTILRKELERDLRDDADQVNRRPTRLGNHQSTTTVDRP